MIQVCVMYPKMAKHKPLPPLCHLSSWYGAQTHRSHFILSLFSYNTYIIHAYLNQDIRHVLKPETV